MLGGVGLQCGRVADLGAAVRCGGGLPPPVRYTQIAVGPQFSCALRSDRKAVCWGRGLILNPTPPKGRYTEISAGYGHACALTTTGHGVCWGTNINGQTNVPEGRYLHISAGYNTSCALALTEKIVCWGGGYARGDATPQGRFTQISSGVQDRLACALTPDGRSVCWGSPMEGKGTVPADTAARFTQISAGFRHVCGLRRSGAAECWGLNIGGQLNVPAGRYRQISAGYRDTCAVTLSGKGIAGAPTASASCASRHGSRPVATSRSPPDSATRARLPRAARPSAGATTASARPACHQSANTKPSPTSRARLPPAMPSSTAAFRPWREPRSSDTRVLSGPLFGRERRSCRPSWSSRQGPGPGRWRELRPVVCSGRRRARLGPRWRSCRTVPSGTSRRCAERWTSSCSRAGRSAQRRQEQARQSGVLDSPARTWRASVVGPCRDDAPRPLRPRACPGGWSHLRTRRSTSSTRR